jgi:hypothetical protein
MRGVSSAVSRGVRASVAACLLPAIVAAACGGQGGEATELAGVTTASTALWGDPLDGASSTSRQPPQPAAASPTGPKPDPVEGAAADSSATTAGQGPRPTSPTGPGIGPSIGATGTGPFSESEGDPDRGGPEPGGDFPISANTSDDYPLEAMVDLAVRLLRAELTGEGSELYPHLAGRVDGPCCTDLVINGAVVLFASSPEDPATITVDWRAAEIDGGGIRRAVTETRWWWSDGSWLAEFDREAAR